jgi:hypothetical protein
VKGKLLCSNIYITIHYNNIIIILFLSLKLNFELDIEIKVVFSLIFCELYKVNLVIFLIYNKITHLTLELNNLIPTTQRYFYIFNFFK